MQHKIIFSNHAKHQIKERNISELEVRLTITAPNRTIPETTDKFRAMRLVKRSNKLYLLVVIFRDIDRNQKIITVFLTSKIKKYLYS